jgi:hypothetical protein
MEISPMTWKFDRYYEEYYYELRAMGDGSELFFCVVEERQLDSFCRQKI